MRALVMLEGRYFVAQCLERDIVAQAHSFARLEYELAWALVGQIIVMRMHGQALSEMRPAPQDYFKRFEAAKPVGTWRVREREWNLSGFNDEVRIAACKDMDTIDEEGIEVRREVRGT